MHVVLKRPTNSAGIAWSKHEKRCITTRSISYKIEALREVHNYSLRSWVHQIEWDLGVLHSVAFGVLAHKHRSLHDLVDV